MRHTLLLALAALMCIHITACAESSTGPVEDPEPPDTLWVKDYHLDILDHIIFSSDESFIACASNSAGVSILATQNGELLQQIITKTPVSSIALSPDNTLLAVACADEKIYLYHPLSATPVGTPLEGHLPLELGANILDLDFSPDGRYLVSAGSDHIIVWDVASGKELHRFGGGAENNYGRSATFLANSSLFAYVDRDSLLFVQLPQGTVRKVNAAYELYHLQYSAATRHLAGLARVRVPHAESTDKIVLIDTETGNEVRTVYQSQDKYDEFRAFTLTPGGRYLFSSYIDGIIRVWDTMTGTLLKTMAVPNKWNGYIPHSCLAVSPDSQYVASALDIVFLWRSPWNTTTGLQSGTTGKTPTAMLSAPYPVPGTDDITLSYNLAVAADVLLEVYDAQGNKLAVLTEQYHAPGDYKLLFRPAQYNLAAGTYFCRLLVNNSTVATSILSIRA